jgi:uncharacterized protein
MRIFVRVKPKSKRPRIEPVDLPGGQAGATHFVIAVSEPPVGGKATRAAAAALAGHFGVSLSRVTLVSGGASREKVFEID